MDEIYTARHAKNDEEDRFADIENFDVEDTEPIKEETDEENENDLDGTEDNEDYSNSYGDDFDYRSVASKPYIPSANPINSKDYGDGFDSQTGEDRREFVPESAGNDYESGSDADNYYLDKSVKRKNPKRKNNRATVVCVVVATAVIIICASVFALSKCSFDFNKPTVTTAPSTDIEVTTQEPTTEYYEPETEPEYVPDYTEYAEETTEPPATEEYTEPETEPYTEEYTEPETDAAVSGIVSDTEPETEYVPDETTQIV